jgi:hypothetical protein
MTLNESVEIIEDFAWANDVDMLRAIELMVDHYPKLGTHEQSALTIFMAETKVKTSG